MASEYCTRFSSRPVTLMRQRFASVFTSYSSLMATVLAALALSPLYFTFPLSQASAAWLLVLNKRMAQRYLSRRSFSFSGMDKIRIFFGGAAHHKGFLPQRAQRCF